MTITRRRSIIIIGTVLVIIGVFLLIFGFISQDLISEERARGMSTGNYQFWNNMETTRQYSIPVSVVLILVGGGLVLSQLLIPSDTIKTTGASTSVTAEKNKFVGTWKEGNATFIFFSDGTGALPEGVSTTWDIKDGKLVITTSNQLSTYTYSYSFSNNDKNLTLTSTNETLHLTKQ